MLRETISGYPALYREISTHAPLTLTRTAGEDAVSAKQRTSSASSHRPRSGAASSHGTDARAEVDTALAKFYAFEAPKTASSQECVIVVSSIGSVHLSSFVVSPSVMMCMC
jgi:hypothetical protein